VPSQTGEIDEFIQKGLAQRVGFATQRFAKLFAVKDMPQNAVFTAISVNAGKFRPQQLSSNPQPFTRTLHSSWPAANEIAIGLHHCGNKRGNGMSQAHHYSKNLGAVHAALLKIHFHANSVPTLKGFSGKHRQRFQWQVA